MILSIGLSVDTYTVYDHIFIIILYKQCSLCNHLYCLQKLQLLMSYGLSEHIAALG